MGGTGVIDRFLAVFTSYIDSGFGLLGSFLDLPVNPEVDAYMQSFIREKIAEIMKFGIMTTPGLVVDGQVKSAGKALSTDDIKRFLAP